LCFGVSTRKKARHSPLCQTVTCLWFRALSARISLIPNPSVGGVEIELYCDIFNISFRIPCAKIRLSEQNTKQNENFFFCMGKKKQEPHRLQFLLLYDSAPALSSLPLGEGWGGAYSSGNLPLRILFTRNITSDMPTLPSPSRSPRTPSPLSPPPPPPSLTENLNMP